MAIKIYIDQGHGPGGINGGAEAFGLTEQDITFQVGIYLANLLNNTPGYEAKVSRETITTILGYNTASSLAARVTDANQWGADYFISLHCNAATNPDYNGTEVIVFSEMSPAYPLARSVLEQIVLQLGTKNNGVVARTNLYVLRRTQMPSLLVELAFLTNYNDAQKLKNDQFGFAQAIYDGIRITLG